MKKHNYDPSKIFYPREELSNFIDSKTIKHLIETKETQNHYENKIIIGDGLEAMAAMEFGRNKAEAFKADIVMIDPPYNEDKSGGKYQDQWKGSGKDFGWAGENHGAYLDYLHPRIVLGKNSLTEEGCMMLFIGDGEYHRVRLLMEMVFGEKNYIGTIVWDSSSNQQKTKKINRTHEYVIIFAKNIKKFEGLYEEKNGTPKDILQDFANDLDKENYKKSSIIYNDYLTKYANKMKDEGNNSFKDIKKYKYILPNSNIIFRDSDIGDPKNGNFMPMLHPLTKEACGIPRKGFRVSKEYINKLNETEEYYELPDGKYLKVLENKNATAMMGVVFGKTDKTVPQQARIHKKELNKVVLTTYGFDYKTEDKKIGIPSNSGFNTVKPYEFLTKLILSYPKKESVVMDFFGGSGTTAIAVNDANKNDNGNRSWVLVEMNENTVEETMIPRLNYFEIEDYKIFKVDESEIDEDKLLDYFSMNLENHLKANYNYKEIDEDINDLNILGIEKGQLIFYKKPDNIDLPRISKSTRFFKKISDKYDLKSIKAYVINKELLSVFEDLKQSLKNEGVKLEISTIPEEFKKNWDNNLTILTGEKR